MVKGCLCLQLSGDVCCPVGPIADPVRFRKVFACLFECIRFSELPESLVESLALSVLLCIWC